ncbi:hypothetical protein PLICRDRAFT_695028 [Plicaturopsis crispa FD-325 SS-3]|nr:hypothetical protein PLICRDRAFT_695028 [Plicaturopsis crispa FD-325 SS-3]
MHSSFSSWPHSPVMAPVNIDDLAKAQADRQKKPRHRHSPAQLAALNELYDKTEHPSLDQRTTLAERLGMETKTVNAWFQNKRASSKKRNRGGAHKDLLAISSTHASTPSSSTSHTPHYTDIDDYPEDEYPPPSRYPRRSTSLAATAADAQEQTFYAGNNDNKHHFAAQSEAMTRKIRMRPSAEQTDELRKLYNKNPHPTREEREELGERIGMRYQSITNWFQNQRSLAKKRKEDEEAAEHEPPTFSALPPAAVHPSLLPPPSSHPSLSLPVSHRKRSPSISAPPALLIHTPSSRRSTPRRSTTPYSTTTSLSRPRRTRPEPYQLDALKGLLSHTSNPSIEERTALALETGMDLGKVTNWFRNLRQTARKRAKKGDYADEDSVSGHGHNDSASASRFGTPSFHSSASSSANDAEERMDLDEDDYALNEGGHSDIGSEDEYQEAVTPSPEPSPPPSSFSVSSIKHHSHHSSTRGASVRVLGMLVDSSGLHPRAEVSPLGATHDEADLLLHFKEHVVHQLSN